MKSVFAFAMLFVTSSIVGSAQGAIITQWNFNSNPADGNNATGVTTPSTGAGTLALVGGTTSLFASGDAGIGSTDPATGDDSGLGVTTFAASGQDRQRGIQFNVSTAGYKDLTITWDVRNSNTSSRYAQFQYSLNGSAFTDFGALFTGTGDTWTNSRSINLTSIAGANNDANFAFRIVSATDPTNPGTYLASGTSATYAASGNWRFDMVTVSGTAVASVPEPTSMAVLGACGVVGLVTRRLRAKRAKS